jgi:hypothetical protein
MLKLRKRIKFVPISMGPFNNKLISRSYSHNPELPVWRFANTPEKSQCVDTITGEEFFDVPVSYDYMWDYSHIGFSQYRSSYFLRTNGIKYADNTVLFPAGTNDYVLVVCQARAIPPTVASIEDVFEELYTKWYEQSKYDSNIGNSTDVYYERIIKLGDSVVPFIINKLKKDCAHMFIALCRITGENPVKKENMGKVKKMAEDWIQWWEKKDRDKG